MMRFVVISLLFLYWGWLCLTSQMMVMYDSIDYLRSGELMAQGGLEAYVRQGPAREPIYPFLIAAANLVADKFSFSLLDVLRLLQMGLLALSLFLFRRLLRHCHIPDGISWCLVLYMGLSPAIVNSALSIYSEIAVLPLVLFAVLVYRRAFYSGLDRAVICWAVAAGIISTALVLVKAASEFSVPFFMFMCIFVCRGVGWRRFIPLLVAAIVFFAGVNAYKSYNLALNGNYVVTNRASWALFGSTKRRTEPMTLRSWGAGVLFMGGRGVCERFFTPDECVYWSFETSDALSGVEIERLSGLNLPPREVAWSFLSGSLGMVLRAPFQYVFFSVVEGMKMFFWETTQLGFVEYPPVLKALFSSGLFGDGLRAFIFIVSLAGFIFFVLRLARGRGVPDAALISFIFFISVAVAYVPFLILTRYALPTAPLLLLLTGLMFVRKEVLSKESERV